jgi:cytochrome b561
MAHASRETHAVSGYSGLQITLHWIVAAIVIFQVAAGDSMGALWRATTRGETVSGTDQLLGQIHVWGGVAVLIFALWRLWLRHSRGVPAPPESEPAPLRFVASATHVLLYLILIGAPLMGMAAWFGGVRDAAEIHEMVKLPLIVLVALHVIGALAQHFWMRSDVLKRMLRPQT